MSTARWLAALLALTWLAAPATAATACSATASAIAFGIYDTLLPDANDTTGTVTVSCMPGLGSPLNTSYTLTVAGTGTGNDSVRSVSFSTDRLYFQIYKEATHTQVWGNGIAASGLAASVTSVATGVAGVRVHTAYARMPGQQAARPGIYGGTVLVTIDY